VHYYGIGSLLITLLPTLARAQTPLPFVYPTAEFDRPFEGLLIINRLDTEAEGAGGLRVAGACTGSFLLSP